MSSDSNLALATTISLGNENTAIVIKPVIQNLVGCVITYTYFKSLRYDITAKRDNFLPK